LASFTTQNNDNIEQSNYIKNTMIKIDPIITVKDVEASTKWYQQVFGFRRVHGENESFVVFGVSVRPGSCPTAITT
jgi:catechol-2,3-dioxygenase